MNHQLQQELSRKADDWKVNSLQQELDRTKIKVKNLEQKVGELESSNRGKYDVISRLIDIIMSADPFTEDEKYCELNNLKQQLY